MSITKKSFKIQDWKPLDDTEFRYEGEDRPAKRIIIGTMQQPGGAEQYIVEEMYSDIYSLITNKMVTVHVDIYSDPMVVLERDGKLILHNARIKILKDETVDMLNSNVATKSNQIRALVEMRNNSYSDFSLGRAVRNLRQNLSEGMDAPLNYYFLKLTLTEHYPGLYEKTDLATKFRTYSKEDLIATYGGLIEKILTNAAYIEPAKSLVEAGESAEDIEIALKDEICRRFFEGSIH